MVLTQFNKQCLAAVYLLQMDDWISKNCAGIIIIIIILCLSLKIYLNIPQ